MGRRPLEIGKWGKIQLVDLPDGRVRARARVRDTDGITREATCIGKSKNSALTGIKAELKHRTAPVRGSITPSTRLTAVADIYFSELEKEVADEQKGPQTLRRYRQVWKSHLEPRVGGWQVRDVSPGRVKDVLEELRDIHKGSTTSLYRSVFSVILNRAWSAGALKDNPLTGRRINIRGDAHQEIKALDGKQVQQVIVRLGNDEHAVKHDLPDLMLWMVSMGERINGALALHWPWVDWDAKEVHIGPNVILNEQYRPILNTRNSGKVNLRPLSVPDRALAMLQNRWGKKTALGAPWNPMGPVFPNRLGELRRSSGVHRVLRPALDRAGFESLKPHTMRKTNATVLANAGTSKGQLAKMLGHRSERTAEQYYVRHESINPMGVASIDALLDEDDPGNNVMRPDFG